MKPERPSLLTYASSDGDVDWEQYRQATVSYLLDSRVGDDTWEDWPADED